MNLWEVRGAVYERYLNGRGEDKEVYSPAAPQKPGKNDAGGQPPEHRDTDKEKRPGIFGSGSRIGDFLQGFNINLDSGDMLLILLMESDDEEIIIVLVLILLFGKE